MHRSYSVSTVPLQWQPPCQYRLTKLRGFVVNNEVDVAVEDSGIELCRKRDLPFAKVSGKSLDQLSQERYARVSRFFSLYTVIFSKSVLKQFFLSKQGIGLYLQEFG
jgi:hypothetical protein